MGKKKNVKKKPKIKTKKVVEVVNRVAPESKTIQKKKKKEKAKPTVLSSLCNDKNVIDVELIVNNVLMGPDHNETENITEVRKLAADLSSKRIDIVYYLPADKQKADEAKRKRLVSNKRKLNDKYGQKVQDQLKRIDNQLEGKDEIDIEIEDAPAPDPDITFTSFGLSPPLMQAIAELQYTEPTLIQKVVIPLGTRGRDILACAKTGTGKTAAYLIPIIERLLHAPDSTPTTRVLIILPTRELAIQVYENAVSLSKFTKISVGMAVGGLKITYQAAELAKKPDIIVATPGRLIASLLLNENFSLNEIEILVVDEADRMLDKSFKEQLKEVAKKLDDACQIYLLSATMTEAVKDLTMVSLRNPIRAFVSNNTEVATTLKQEFAKIKKEEHRLPALIHFLKNIYTKHVLVFVPLKNQCTALYILLRMAGLNAVELHGDQSQKERMSSLNGFKSGENDILIATDVASRGLDIPGIETVINLFLPPVLETYIHRAGRAGRAGNVGHCVSLFANSNVEREQFRVIKKESQLSIYQREIANGTLKAGVALVDKLLPFVREAFDIVTKRRAKYLAILDKRYKNSTDNKFTLLSKSMSNVKKKGKDFYCSLLADAVYQQQKGPTRTDKRYLKKMQRLQNKENKTKADQT